MQDRNDEALKHLLRAVEVARGVVGSNPPSRIMLATHLSDLGDVYMNMRRWQDSVAAYEESAAIRRLDLGTNNPVLALLPLVINNLAFCYLELNRVPEAEKAVREAIKIQVQLDRESGDPSSMLANYFQSLAEIQSRSGRCAQALGSLAEARKVKGWELFRSDIERVDAVCKQQPR